MPQTDVVPMLHSHLPYVLNHGQWPHGSDRLCEAAVESYLPPLELQRDDDVFRPIHPSIVRALEASPS